MSLPPQEPKRRNNIMCKNCRHDKQRCEPRDYNWQGGGKCERCVKLGYECSVPEKKERAKRNQKRSEIVFDGMPQRLGSDDRIFQSIRQAASAGDSNTQTVRGRPVVSWFADADNAQHSNIIAGDSDTPASEDFTQVGKSSETEARHLVAKLSTLLVLRVLFEQDLVLLTQIEKWTETSVYIDTCRAALQDFVARVMDESQKVKEKAESLIIEKRPMGAYKGEFVRDIENLVEKLYNFRESPLPECNKQWVDSPSALFRKEKYRLQKRKNISSAAAMVVEGVHNCTQQPVDIHRDSDATQVANFQQAGEEIKAMLSDMQLNDPRHDRIFFRSSACGRISLLYFPSHLAVRNSTESILKQLWTESLATPWELDCFGRTPVHYGAYYACVSNLETIFKHSRKLVVDLRPDQFGMTPLAIAACKDDIKSFRLLLKHGAPLDVQVNGRSVLALAARNNSIEVVKHILALDQLPISLSSELVEATERGHKEIAQLLMQKYDSMPMNEYSLQIDHAHGIAQRRNERELTETLVSRHSMPNTQQAAIALHDLEYSQNNVSTHQELLDSEQAFGFNNSQSSFVGSLWDYNTSPSSFADRFVYSQTFEPLSFEACGGVWFDDQNQNPSGWVDD